MNAKSSTSTSTPSFSICIPNYNYARYIGETIRSVLSQSVTDLEIVVRDNASTDGSADVVRSFADVDARVRWSVNACNVGFAGNLDRVGNMARGETMIMLSSDDLMCAGALAKYRAVLDAMGSSSSRSRVVLTSALRMIDGDGRPKRRLGADAQVWRDAKEDAALSRAAGAPVLRMPAGEVLRRSLLTQRNPFPFAATAYPRVAYAAVEGYGGGRLINPDKWFHWKLLGQVDEALFVDDELFQYRWHASNQNAQESEVGALKYLIDEYVSTFEIDAALLKKAGLDKRAVEVAFVKNDVVRHGLATLARGNRKKARRILDFGRAAYPQHVKNDREARVLSLLLGAGPLGARAAQAAYALKDRIPSLGRARE